MALIRAKLVTEILESLDNIASLLLDLALETRGNLLDHSVDKGLGVGSTGGEEVVGSAALLGLFDIGLAVTELLSKRLALGSNGLGGVDEAEAVEGGEGGHVVDLGGVGLDVGEERGRSLLEIGRVALEGGSGLLEAVEAVLDIGEDSLGGG